MTDKINEFVKAFAERMKSGLKEGDQSDEALYCMIKGMESALELIGKLTEYKSFTNTDTEKDLVIELYSETVNLLSCIKYFNDEYTAYVKAATRKEEEELIGETTDYDHPQRYTGEDGKDLIDRFEEGLMIKDAREKDGRK